MKTFVFSFVFYLSEMVSPGSWQLMIMEQRQAGHLAWWDNSTSMALYMLVGETLCDGCSVINIILLSAFPYRLLSALFVFNPRWHERDRSSHKQAVRRRLGGLRVPFYSFHRLPLSFGWGCGWREKHQHLLQLENVFLQTTHDEPFTPSGPTQILFIDTK